MHPPQVLRSAETGLKDHTVCLLDELEKRYFKTQARIIMRVEGMSGLLMNSGIFNVPPVH